MPLEAFSACSELKTEERDGCCCWLQAACAKRLASWPAASCAIAAVLA